MINDKAVHQFVRDRYSTPEGRNPLQAIRDIARLYGIAVAYLDRKVFDSYLDDHLSRPLTDEEWARISNFDSEYDEFVDATPGPTGSDVSSEFIRYWLNKHGIPGPDGEKWSES
jgi:hypothetical protein